MFKKLEMFLSGYNSVNAKERIINSLVSFIFALIIIAPLFILEISVMMVYYNCHTAMVIAMFLELISMGILYTKFRLDIILKKYDFEGIEYAKYLYLYTEIEFAIPAIVSVIIYFVMFR